tara:strand:- start:1766 stop:1987 length:222 start_codon:yes stop_codon:yes gene_type:complete
MVDSAAPNAKAAAQDVLLSTDWTQLPNSGLTSDCVTKFATYRSAVRVIRQDNNSIEKQTSDYTWPTVPTEEWS